MTATNPVTLWRAALIALLKQSFPAADVVGGERSGIAREKDRIAVFWQRSPFDANVNYVRPRITVRYWTKVPKASAMLKDVPRDDGPIEQAGWDIVNALMPQRTTLVTNLYYEIYDVSPNRAEDAVDVILAAYVLSPGAIPA